MAESTADTYRRAAKVAGCWVAAAAALAVAAAYLRVRLDPGESRGDVVKFATLAGFAALPLAAGLVHRTFKVVTLTALFEAALLGGALLAVAVYWRL
jgi:hypothetical protein